MSGDDRILRQIAQRLSLRAPQERSLGILADVLEGVSFEKGADPDTALAAIQEAYPSVESFDGRDFPSLCFALATGVGKTRLMGAFITYLYLTGRSKNFFVLAPNTTIYDKLVADFSKPSSPKYVFRGIAQFAQAQPLLITGENWEHAAAGRDLYGHQNEAVINIFNVDKVNKDKGRIRSMRETLGESYFDYLSALPDLVLLMDEAHRYRAKAGMKTIAELNPVLGLELTATPKSVGANSKPFENVVFDYGLGNAMADGFVKEPAVATRANFRKSDFSQDQLEEIMLKDGVRYHEHVKAELELYALQTGRPRVHPFILIVAQDTAHAAAIRQKVESDQFFGGVYKDRVAEVHSNLKGEESDEAMQRLVGLETDAVTEIVIHVNKLKEGWDVTNLYTIIPLRASASDILTEQTLGRGLRLPYGERTGVETVDTLTVVAHDRFEEVVNRARAADSLVQVKTLTIGKGGDVSEEGTEIVSFPTTTETLLTGIRPSGFSDGGPQAPFIFDTEQARHAASMAIDLIQHKYEHRLTESVQQLIDPKVQNQLVEDLRRTIQPAQGTLDVIADAPDLEAIVGEVTASIARNTIEIPEIVVIPSREVNFWFENFDLTSLDSVRFQPLSDKILIRTLRDDTQRELAWQVTGPIETQVENYIVKHLIDFDQVDYDSQSDLLYKLAEQVVDHLRTYLSTEDEVENVALAHGKKLAGLIFEQMKRHYRETPTEYRVKKVRAFRMLRPQHFAISSLAKRSHIRDAVTPLSETRGYIFYGTRKSPYAQHKFHSDPERRFAALIDSDFEKDVLRWLKPGPGQFGIEYRSGKTYEPDFVIETTKGKLIVEVKADRDINSPDVVEKSRAAIEWVKNANSLDTSGEGKKWSYAIVPESAVTASATLEGLSAAHRKTSF